MRQLTGPRPADDHEGPAPAQATHSPTFGVCQSHGTPEAMQNTDRAPDSFILGEPPSLPERI